MCGSGGGGDEGAECQTHFGGSPILLVDLAPPTKPVNHAPHARACCAQANGQPPPTRLIETSLPPPRAQDLAIYKKKDLLPADLMWEIDRVSGVR